MQKNVIKNILAAFIGSVLIALLMYSYFFSYWSESLLPSSLLIKSGLTSYYYQPEDKRVFYTSESTNQIILCAEKCSIVLSQFKIN